VTVDDVLRFQEAVLTSAEGGKPRNREKRLQRAGGLFRWAKVKRYIADDFDQLFKYPGQIEENPYLKFDDHDLLLLFESEDYCGHRFKTPSEYRLPLIALFTGARLNEICQLTTRDIGIHENIDTLSILDEDSKRLKTIASRRIIPIHSQLIELGFLDYVSSIQSGRLFPELPEDLARPGNFGPKSSELFTAYRRKCGVGEIKERSSKVFHSFRATLISALRKANVPKDRRTRLAGHEYSDTQDRNYTGGDVLTMFDFATLKADIELVKYTLSFTSFERPLVY
jgi:integrase